MSEIIQGSQVIWGIPSGRQSTLIVTESGSYEETSEIKVLKNEVGVDSTRVIYNPTLKLDIAGIANTASILPDIGSTAGFPDKGGTTKKFRVISASEEYANASEKKMKISYEHKPGIDT
jgi:hypothetical protein